MQNPRRRSHRSGRLQPDRGGGDASLPAGTRARGRISRLVKGRGYGFIVEDGQREEVEFHWTAVTAGGLEQLSEGQRVEFDKLADHREGVRTRAINVRLIPEGD